jgi:hypothetical protein
MRKALIGLVLAATMMTPVAAEAQNWRGRDGGRGERSQEGVDGGEARSERVQQQRQERQAQRAERAQQQAQQVQQQQQVQQAPQQVQQPAQAQVVQRGDGNRGYRGGGGNGYRGNRGGGDNNGANFQRGGGDNGNANANYQRGTNNYQGGGRRGGNQGSIYPDAWQGNPNDPQQRHYQELERRNQQRYGNGGRNDGGNWRNDNRGGNRNWSDNRGGRNNWNRNWRNDNRYDWQRYRYSNRNIFHVGPYYSPYRGYGYNRFSIGIFLDPFFYGQQYWIGDPWQYRLPPAYPGTQWVRYYNDVLLVDVYTGEVLDTIYDFFW